MRCIERERERGRSSKRERERGSWLPEFASVNGVGCTGRGDGRMREVRGGKREWNSLEGHLAYFKLFSFSRVYIYAFGLHLKREKPQTAPFNFQVFTVISLYLASIAQKKGRKKKEL